MAMDGTILGTAIGNAFYDAIPASVKSCMTADAKAEMCNALINNAKVIANCVVAHISTYAVVTVAGGIPVGIPATSPEGSPSTGATTSTGTGTIA